MKRPTVFQAITLKHLIDGWKLIDGDERIYWKFKMKLSNGSVLNDTIDCGYPKLKRYRMSWLEKYGWIVKINDQWKITPSGRQAYKTCS